MVDLQPVLSNEFVTLTPLEESDYQALYNAASDPDIWIQHPNPERYREEVFQTFFRHAVESGGAFAISDNANGVIIGSSRFYELNEESDSVFIGYTFFRRAYWGGRYNYSTKLLMLDYIFQYVGKVFFHIGKVNLRSRFSIERLGANFVREIEVEYAGEAIRPNFEYCIEKEQWSLILANILHRIKG